MKDIASLERRLNDLASEVHCHQVPSTDEDGKPAWIDGCGLHVSYQVMKLRRDLGRETKLEDFPPELLKQIKLWSRAKLNEADGQVGKITKELCQQILAEGHR